MSKRLEFLKKMVAEGSTDPFVHYGLALEHVALGQGGEARAAFAALRARFPDYLPQYIMAAQLFQKEGLDDEARRAATEGLSLARVQGNAKTASELQGLLDELS